jgi:hypothetical protein
MMMSDILAAFQIPPLRTRVEKRTEGTMRTVTITGPDLAECATWGTPCAAPPPFLAALAVPHRAGLCQVRHWQGTAWLVCWADGEHVWVCEELTR